jgi:UDP-N-acetylmuramate dehydrogenase
MNIAKLLPGVQRNISLKNYTTFKSGGLAKYFFEAKTEKEIIKAITVAKKSKLPFFVLGGGSNILFSDKGFKGIVIKIKNQELKIKGPKIKVDAGVSLGQIVNLATKKNLTGLEWAIGIPGTIGGAVYGNAGWPMNKKNIGSVVEKVEALNVKKLEIQNCKTKDCRFGYRDSIFKYKKNLIILSVVLKLKVGKKEKITKEILEILKKRSGKIPVGFSAGSVFKNPNTKDIKNKKILKDFQEIKNFNDKIPAGFLIEKCGLRGRAIGGAKISEKHANIIVNLGKGTAKDVQSLINLAKTRVKAKFGVVLREEIVIL